MSNASWRYSLGVVIAASAFACRLLLELVAMPVSGGTVVQGVKGNPLCCWSVPRSPVITVTNEKVVWGRYYSRQESLEDGLMHADHATENLRIPNLPQQCDDDGVLFRLTEVGLQPSESAGESMEPGQEEEGITPK